MLLRSIQINSVMSVKVKGVITLKMLEKLIKKTRSYTNGKVFAAMFTVAFFGFFRLSTVLPNKLSRFKMTLFLVPQAFPIQNDIVFGAPGMHMIVICTKTMQGSNQMQVVQLPALSSKEFCSVTAIKDLLKSSPRCINLSLFQILTKNRWAPLTAPGLGHF